MKKSLFFLVIFSLLVACSKDNDNTLNESIPGNHLGTGQSAQDLLANDIFSSLNIEVVYSDNFQPEQASLDNLKTFLEERTFKNTININLQNIEAPEGAPYNIEEIRTIEENTRTNFNTENTIEVYVFFANGSSENDEGNKVTLGTAYQNTSIVIFEKTIKDFASSSVSAPSKTALETVTLQHEFGHLFGLVNIGSSMQTNHEDPGAEAHCNTEGCLMNAEAALGGGLMGMLGNGVIPELGPNCIADLQANGGK